MKNITARRTRILCISTLLSLFSAQGAWQLDPEKSEEFRGRDGLPNVFSKIEAGQPVRIAYFGGSITYAGGWRPKTLAWFREQFPRTEFSEINAAIPGTGSNYGACRLKEDVLQHKPDLVFVEFRVNGGGGFEQQSIEGIVRQIWRDNPQADICFAYTLGIWMLKDLQAERNTTFGETMESTANHYGIPSIDFGLDIAKREQAGTLIFKADKPEKGKFLFSNDGVHPTDDGHQIYSEIVARSMLKMSDQRHPLEHELVQPMNETCWETATLLPITEAHLSAGWSSVDERKDPVYNSDAQRTKAMLRGAVKCNREGETITVKWNGTNIALSDIPHGGTIVIEAVVDGKTVADTERKQTEMSRKFARFWHIPEQPPGEHEIVFTIKQLPEGTSFYAGQLLVIGTPTRQVGTE